MRTWEKYAFSALTAGVSATGLLYFWMKYMLVTDDPFAVVNHPLQGLMLHLHVLAAPVFLVVFGVIFNSHVTRKIGRTVQNRRSGLLSLATIVFMTASGYLLQVFTGETTRYWLMVVHVASGCLFSMAYVTHLAVSLRMWLRERGAVREASAA